MSDSDLKQHVNSSQDFYALLELESSATDAEIRRAYRLTARKYHPDKVGASESALEKFHLLQIAYGVLSDDALKESYDATRRAREEQKARQSAFSDRRKAMVEELERRESGAVKRKHEELAEEEQFEREVRRLAADGKRRREELQFRLRQEELRQEALNKQEEVRAQEEDGTQAKLDDIDRAVSLRFKKNDITRVWNEDFLSKTFKQFGDIEAIVLKEKRLKPPGMKHREDYYTATLLYKTIVGAHAAVTGICRVQAATPDLQYLENVTWTGKTTSDTPQQDTVLGKKSAAQNESSQKKVPKFSFNPKAKT